MTQRDARTHRLDGSSLIGSARTLAALTMSYGGLCAPFPSGLSGNICSCKTVQKEIHLDAAGVAGSENRSKTSPGEERHASSGITTADRVEPTTSTSTMPPTASAISRMR
jgi:hypothetical protein